MRRTFPFNPVNRGAASLSSDASGNRYSVRKPSTPSHATRFVARHCTAHITHFPRLGQLYDSFPDDSSTFPDALKFLDNFRFSRLAETPTQRSHLRTWL